MTDKSINSTIDNIKDMLDQEITALQSIYKLLSTVAGDYKREGVK